jgi:hypothetical protein
MLYALYSSNIIRVMKSIIMSQAGHVARMGDKRAADRFLVGNLRERNHLEAPDVGGSIILKWIFKKLDTGHGLE